MNTTPGDRSRGGVAPASAAVAAAGEQVVRAIRSHAEAVAKADEAAARTARAAVRSAMGTYSWTIADGWDEVSPFPLPHTWRDGQGPVPREVLLRVTYHLRVLDQERLMEVAEEVACAPVPDSAEAAAALYGAQLWVPAEQSGLAYVCAAYGGRFADS